MSLLHYLFLALVLFSVLGKILSVWLKQDPKGMGNLGTISEGLKSGGSWQIPLVAIGGALLFFYNAVVYAVFAITQILLLFARILRWIYDNVIRQSLVFVWKLLVNYGVKIPFTVLAATANSSGEVIKWDRYRNILRLSLILYISAALLSFFIHALGLPDLKIVFFAIATLLGLAYTTGELAGNSNSSGRKSMGYMMLYILCIGLLLGVVYLLNVGNAQKDFGGFLAGLVYSPSVLMLALVIVMVLLSVFIANAGAVYFATTSEASPTLTLRGVLVSLFQRSWYFIFQPIWTLLVTAVLWLVPVFLLQTAATNLYKIFVEPNLAAKNINIEQKIKSDGVLNNLGAYLSPDTTEDSYSRARKAISTEVELNEQLNQNRIYSGYLSSAVELLTLPNPVLSNEEIKQQKDEAKDLYANRIKQYNERIKSENEQIKQMETNFSQSGAVPGSEQEAFLKKNISNRKTAVSRLQGFTDELSKAADTHTKYVDGLGTSYGLTYFVFLLSKFLFVALLMAIFWGVWASSSNRVYPMRKDSYFVAWVKQEKAASPYQPWAGWLVLALPIVISQTVSGSSSFLNVLMGSFKNLNPISEINIPVSEMPSENKIDDGSMVNADDLNLSSDQWQTEAPAESVLVDSVAAPVSEEPVEAPIVEEAEPEADGVEYVVSSTICNIYTEPNTDSEKKGYIVYGENVKLIQNVDEMGYVSYTNPKNGKKTNGYVLLSKIKPAN